MTGSLTAQKTPRDQTPDGFPKLAAVVKLYDSLRKSYDALPADQKSVDFLIYQLAFDRTTRLFEDIYQSMFRTQAMLLIGLGENRQVSMTEARNLYGIGPHEKRGYAFEAWLKWLLDFDLVDVREDRLTLSARGRDFVEWTVETNHPLALIRR